LPFSPALFDDENMMIFVKNDTLLSIYSFDLFGLPFGDKRLTVAAKTVEKHVVHYRQLYEQLSIKKPPQMRWL
jgi:hypothetical protein